MAVNFPNLPELLEEGEREILSVDELAAYWGVTPASVRSAAWKGTVPGAFRRKGIYVFDRELVLAEWVPPKVRSWAASLNLPAISIAGSSGLKVEGGRKALQDAAVARLHDLHVLVTTKRWATIILKAVDQAEEGDWRARKWLGDYLMGPPVQRVEAEVAVSDSRSFSDEMRSQAVEALLAQSGARRVVDVTPRPVETENESAASDQPRKAAT